MSDSEQKGRCRSEVDRSGSGGPVTNAIADAIDRLAADVAAVMEMTREIALRVPSEFGQDACDAAVRVALKERDAAVRERDEARALLKLAQVQRTAAYADRDEARAEVYRLKCSMTETSKERDAAICERDEARAKVESLRESIGAANRLFGAEQAKVERLRKELEQRQPAGNSPETSDSSPAAQQPAAPAAGWLTDEERRALSRAFDLLCDDDGDSPLAGTVQALLARAGAPPVVEVPDLPSNHYARSEAERYRVAMDKAGVPWKEVGRE